jgi:uncharacterized membrane protein YedE/YeeE
MAAPQQHRYDIVATNLLFAGFLLGIGVNFLTQETLFNFQSKILSKQFILTTAVLSLLLTLVHYYYIRQGYRWAKILFFIFFGANLVFIIVDFKGIAAKHFVSPIKEVSFAVQWLLQLAACILLVIGYRNTQWHSEQPLATPEV